LKPVRLSPETWHKIFKKIQSQYPASVTLSRDKMRRVLGFTPRQDNSWKFAKGPAGMYDGYGDYERSVCLDFFDEQKRTMFLLKYGEYVGNQD